MNREASEALIHPPRKRRQSAGSTSGEQGGYRNTYTPCLARDDSEQGVHLENREATETLIHRVWQETTVSREYIWRTGRLQKHLYTVSGKRQQ